MDNKAQLETLAFISELNKNPQAVSQETKTAALLAGCNRGNKFLAQSLLLCNTDVNCRDVTGNTPLMICAMNGFSDIARILIQSGADVNCFNDNGDSALILSVSKYCSTDLVKLLLEQRMINVYHRNKEGCTCLVKAVARLDLVIVQLILEKMFLCNINLNNATLYKQSVFEAHFLAKNLGVLKIFFYLEQEVSQQKPAIISAISQSDIDSVTFLLDYGLVKTDLVNYSSEGLVLRTLKFYKERKSDVSYNDIAIVRKLLDKGDHITFSCKGGIKVLAEAVHIGNSQLLDLLCYYIINSNRMSPHVVENIFYTALLAVVEVCRCDLLTILLQYKSNLLYKNLETLPIEQAFVAGSIDFIDMLLHLGIKIDVKDSIITSIKHSQIHSLKFILSKLRFEAVFVVENSSSGVFHAAVEVGNTDIVKILIAFGADVNGIFEKKTPLMHCRSCEVAKVLFQHGADINQKVGDNDITALRYLFSLEYMANVLEQRNLLIYGYTYLDQISEICIDRFKDLIKDLFDLFLKEGANIEDKDHKGQTILMLASKVEEFGELLKYLIESGADPNSCNLEGQSALHFAVSENCVENAEILLDFNADANSKCHLGMSCLHLTVKDNKQEMMKLLISHGADVNVVDSQGNTPLLLAANLPNTKDETVKCLLDSGANVNHQNHAGHTALMTAASVSFFKIILVLRERGAEVNKRNFDNNENLVAIMVEKCVSCPHYLCHEWVNCIHHLLDNGGSAECVKPKHIFELINRREYKLLQKLIFSGLSPSEVDIEEIGLSAEEPPFSQISTVSPFSFALLTDNSELAKYLSDINFLTYNDVFQRERIKNIRSYLIDCNCNETLSIMDEFYSKPISLERLCLTAISSAVGPGAEREGRIKSLPIPSKFKNELLFHTKLVTETEIDEGDSYFEDNDDDFYDDYDDFDDYYDDSSGYDDDYF